MSEIIRDMGEYDLKEEIMGRTITHIDEAKNQLTLDDGTVLEFESTSDCCAWFEAELSAGNLTDNAITAVEVSDRPVEHSGTEAYTIHVLAANKNIVDIYIDGDPTSGYYCHSINLKVYEPGEQGNE